MKSFILLFIPLCFIAICSFQCEDDFDNCPEIFSFSSSIDIVLSTEKSSYAIGEEITFSSDFSHIIVDDLTSDSYSVFNQSILFDFEIFKVLPANLNVINVDSKIDIEANFTDRVEAESISKEIQIDCDQNCSFDIVLSLLEKGYYGIVFKFGNFSSNDECSRVDIFGTKTEIQHFDILEEIGTTAINFENPSSFEITNTNSFFFKVE